MKNHPKVEWVEYAGLPGDRYYEPVSYTHLDCGIMISASHNPFYDNGIKIINGLGQKMDAEVEAKIESYIDGEQPEIPLAQREYIGRTVDFAAGRNRYIGHLISIPIRSFKNVKVGLDLSLIHI